MESLTVADVKGLKPGTGCLSVFTNAKGGIEDDLIISKTKEGQLKHPILNVRGFFVVALRRQKNVSFG